MPKCVDGLFLLFQLLGQVGKVLHFAAIYCFEQGFARGEMPVKRADAHAGGQCDSFEAGVRATFTKHNFCRLQDTLAVPHGIGARLSCRLPTFLIPSHAARLKSGGTLRIFEVRNTDTQYQSYAMPKNGGGPEGGDGQVAGT